MFKYFINIFVKGWIEATKHITTGGTSNEFVKGDGTLDSTEYATSNSIDLDRAFHNGRSINRLSAGDNIVMHSINKYLRMGFDQYGDSTISFADNNPYPYLTYRITHSDTGELIFYSLKSGAGQTPNSNFVLYNSDSFQNGLAGEFGGRVKGVDAVLSNEFATLSQVNNSPGTIYTAGTGLDLTNNVFSFDTVFGDERYLLNRDVGGTWDNPITSTAQFITNSDSSLSGNAHGLIIPHSSSTDSYATEIAFRNNQFAYRSKEAGTWNAWLDVASEQWVQSQNYIKTYNENLTDKDVNLLLDPGIYRLGDANPNSFPAFRFGNILTIAEGGLSDTYAQLGFSYVNPGEMYVRSGNISTPESDDWQALARLNVPNSGVLMLHTPNARIELKDTNGAVNEKMLKMFFSEGGFLLRAHNDDDSIKQNLLNIDHDGNAEFNGRVKGSDAVAHDEFTTLAQTQQQSDIIVQDVQDSRFNALQPNTIYILNNFSSGADVIPILPDPATCTGAEIQFILSDLFNSTEAVWLGSATGGIPIYSYYIRFDGSSHNLIDKPTKLKSDGIDNWYEIL